MDETYERGEEVRDKRLVERGGVQQRERERERDNKEQMAAGQHTHTHSVVCCVL